MKGILTRHSRGCNPERCSCEPSFKPRVFVDGGYRYGPTVKTENEAIAWRSAAVEVVEWLQERERRLRQELDALKREVEVMRFEGMRAERLFTSRELAELCQVGTRTIHDAIRSGELPAAEVRPEVYRLEPNALSEWRGLRPPEHRAQPMLDIAGMARRLGVSMDYVQSHATELGGIKLPGNGRRMWRFPQGGAA